MSDLLSIQTGDRAPWEPSPFAELVESFHVWDMPLMGHLREAGSDYVFWCVTDGTEARSLWAYALVSARELDDLHRGGPAEFDATFERVTAGKPLTVALYSEENGIEGVIQVVNPGAYQTLHEAIMDEIYSLAGRFAPSRDRDVLPA